MNTGVYDDVLEHKFASFSTDLTVQDGAAIEGYASYFGRVDQGQDIVQAGAYHKSLQQLAHSNQNVKMLWQHDPTEPIGIWDEVREDAKGLYVKGRILSDVARGREAIALIEAGAIDGLSIGYRTVQASKNAKGERLLEEVQLWEVSLVTFPMLASARVGSKGCSPDDVLLRELAGAFQSARQMLATKPRQRS